MHQRPGPALQRQLDFLAHDLDDDPDSPTSLRLAWHGPTVECSCPEAMRLLRALGRDYGRLRELEAAVRRATEGTTP